MTINRWKKKECGSVISNPSRSDDMTYFFSRTSESLHSGGHFICPQEKIVDPKQSNSFFVLPTDSTEVCLMNGVGEVKRAKLNSDKTQAKFENVNFQPEEEKILQ